MTDPLAHQIRETALWVPRAQAGVLWILAEKVDRLEQQMDELVSDAKDAAEAQAPRHD
jgi:hypothetical protein